MKRLDRKQYVQLLAAATVIERDRHGEKVLLLPQGELVKIFRRKRWLSTATFYPYARRFVRNARHLAERGILSVRVLEIACCPAVARHLVTYQPLPGATLRQVLSAADTDRRQLLGGFARFVATLHRKGVYFRSLHFGNVIVAPDGSTLGLIDVADLSLCREPLSFRQRARNFRHMLRYRVDKEALGAFGWQDFLDEYLRAAALSERDAQGFLTMLRPLAKLFSAAG